MTTPCKTLHDLLTELRGEEGRRLGVSARTAETARRFASELTDAACLHVRVEPSVGAITFITGSDNTGFRVRICGDSVQLEKAPLKNVHPSRGTRGDIDSRNAQRIIDCFVSQCEQQVGGHKEQPPPPPTGWSWFTRKEK